MVGGFQGGHGKAILLSGAVPAPCPRCARATFCILGWVGGLGVVAVPVSPLLHLFGAGSCGPVGLTSPDWHLQRGAVQGSARRAVGLSRTPSIPIPGQGQGPQRRANRDGGRVTIEKKTRFFVFFVFALCAHRSAFFHFCFVFFMVGCRRDTSWVPRRQWFCSIFRHHLFLRHVFAMCKQCCRELAVAAQLVTCACRPCGG